MAMMGPGSFLIDTAAAALMGVAIGAERQFGRHPAGLRTNALVCLGASLFTALSGLMADVGSPTRMASYVVSGIGFLGGGVILRDGFNVKGMNTAATLWCSAAVGALCGSGFPLHALAGTAAVLGLHLSLRPLANRIDATIRRAGDVETAYRVEVACDPGREGAIRAILMRHVNSDASMTVRAISTRESDRSDLAVVAADVDSSRSNDRAMQSLLSRLNIEDAVASVRWEKLRAESIT